MAMADDIHNKHFFARDKHYRTLVKASLGERNYNIFAQRVMTDLEKERSYYLRWHAYAMFQTTMMMNIAVVDHTTVSAFIKLLAKEPTAILRYRQFNTLAMRLNGNGAHLCTPTVKEALEQALYEEKQSIKPLAQGSWEQRKHLVVADCLKEMIEKVDSKLPRGKMSARSRRDRSGPTGT